MIVPKNRVRARRLRRGMTLVEMLVAVALLVLMMSIIVQVFTAATGAVSNARTFHEIDEGLHQLDATIRGDLNNVTAKLTPPLDPAKGLGYFEYGENSFADLQGEDSDDYLRFTVKAAEGKVFTGRMLVPPPSVLTGAALQSFLASQPITITSQYAEVIYFLRDGNLYRRVLLVVPERQAAAIQDPSQISAGLTYYMTSAFRDLAGRPLPVSWAGLNDLSARPSSLAGTTRIVLNTLGNLTNRENRWAYQRFGNDFTINGSASGSGPGDASPDDENVDSSGTAIGNGVPDYYPTLYAGVFSPTPNQLIWEVPAFAPRPPLASGITEVMAFPYIFPGAYSQPHAYSATNGLGWIHSPDPTNPQYSSANAAATVTLLNALNHNPIDIGDSLPVPTNLTQNQTWWGFPTWRETLSSLWADPNHVWVNGNGTYNGQPDFLHMPVLPAPGNLRNQLPPMTAAYRTSNQPYTDNAGQPWLALTQDPANAGGMTQRLWQTSWEDDLVMTGVRSFDVKAYDNSYPGYVDLGWGDDPRVNTSANAPFLASTPYGTDYAVNNAPVGTNGQFAASTYGHEGRIPPRVNDYRLDPQFPNGNFPNPASFLSGTFAWNGNVGDDNPGIVRLRRVWDTWSTDYTRARAKGYNPVTAAPIGPPWTPPVYPSYPPPYPMALRGIQIQIRVTDPASQKIKVLTVRQDFTNKL